MSLKEEREFLENVREQLHITLNEIDKRVKKHVRDLHETKKYLYENKTGMDHAEKVAVRQSVPHSAIIGEGVVKKRNQANALLDHPCQSE